MIETLDTSVRLVAVGATLLLLVLLLAGEVRRPIKVALAGLLLGAAAYLFNSAEGLRPSPALRPLIDLGSVFEPFWIWLFARHCSSANLLPCSYGRSPPPSSLAGFPAINCPTATLPVST
ncbi:hypothetical protein [Altererythrobacter litoralis]|uniref:Uncharacterized protein n=1 Tax=Altererythrobacter litoralis TaxID=3113904 RepID=A0ABU7GEB5_9SPHN|nr:hypothetical protein [Erythrobacteraceae bacterium 1XM1-14]